MNNLRLVATTNFAFLDENQLEKEFVMALPAGI